MNESSQSMHHLSMDEIKRLHERRGGKWFSADAMYSFSCRLGYRTELVQAKQSFNVFVSSEASRTYYPGVDMTRYYTVRVCLPNGEIEELSAIRKFTRRDQAWRWFERNKARIIEIVNAYDPATCNPWGGQFADGAIYNLPPDLALLRQVWFIMRRAADE